MDTKQRILDESTRMFMRFGFKSVTMDDIAREMGVSKKTLYQYVDNKADLIEKGVRNHVNCEQCEMKAFHEESQHALEEMAKLSKYVIAMLREMQPTLLYDLKKYYRSSFDLMQTLHKEHVYNTISENLRRGIKEGLYRKDIDVDIIARMYVIKTSALADPDIFPLNKYRKHELFEEAMRYHIRGIATGKGRDLLRQYDF